MENSKMSDRKHRIYMCLLKHRLAVHAKDLDSVLEDIIKACIVGEAKSMKGHKIRSVQEVALSKMPRKHLF